MTRTDADQVAHILTDSGLCAVVEMTRVSHTQDSWWVSFKFTGARHMTQLHNSASVVQVLGIVAEHHKRMLDETITIMAGLRDVS